MVGAVLLGVGGWLFGERAAALLCVGGVFDGAELLGVADWLVEVSEVAVDRQNAAYCFDDFGSGLKLGLAIAWR